MNNKLEQTLIDKFKLSSWAASERIRLLTRLFNFSEEELLQLMKTHLKLFDSLSGEIIDSYTILSNSSLNDRDGRIKDFVVNTPNFPEVEKEISELDEKIKILNEHGISIDDISKNYEILKKTAEAIQLRTRLAFINGLPLDSFTYDGHYTNSHIIWARMQAVKDKICSFDKVYSSYMFNKHCKLTTDELTCIYPLNEQSIDEINTLYEKAKAQGKTWESSYKTHIFNKASHSKSFVPSAVKQAKKEAVYHKALNFADDSYVSGDILPVTQTINLLLENFNLSWQEANQIVLANPRLCKTNFLKFGYLKRAIVQDYDLSTDDLTNIFKAKPSFIQKTDHDYIAYRSFLKEFLSLDDNQIRMILTQKPIALTLNPQQLILGAQAIQSVINVPYPQITSKLVYAPEIFTLQPEEIIYKIQTLTELGFDEKDILSHLYCLQTDASELKTKIIISRINLDSDFAFIKTNYNYDLQTVYARTMFNLENNQELPIYRSNKQYHKLFNMHFQECDLDAEELNQALIQKYPLTQEAIAQLYKFYDSINNDNIEENNNQSTM